MSDGDTKDASARGGNNKRASDLAPNSVHDGAAAKRVKQQGSATNSPSSVAQANRLNHLDDNCRIKIFSYSTWQDLAEAAQASTHFRDDCKHPSMTQIADRQKVLRVGDSLEWYLMFLRESAKKKPHKFATYTKLKVVRGGPLLNLAKRYGAATGPCRIPGIAALELSFDPSEDDCVAFHKRKRYPGIEAGLWRATAECLPNLRHLTVSDDLVAKSAPSIVARACPLLETITWHRQESSNLLSGREVAHAHRLRAMYADDCTFEINEVVDGGPEYIYDGRSPRCLFDAVADRLERVSIKNARCRAFYSPEICAIPQEGIIKFVRRAVNLTWLRSDLTPDNVAMLKLERPDVSFVS